MPTESSPVRLHRNLVLIQVDDREALAEIEALARLSDFQIAELSPTEILIEPDQLKILLERMDKAGIRPVFKR